MSSSIQKQVSDLKRQHILDAAIQVFAQQGFHRSKIKDVARIAGVADGTVYNYFANKDDLLLGILDRFNETEQRSVVLAQPVKDFEVLFQSYLKHRLTLIFEQAELFQALLPEVLSNPDLRERYQQQVIEPTMNLAEEFFTAQAKAGHIRQTDTALLARAIAGTLLGLLVQSMLGDIELKKRWQELPEVLSQMILYGIQSKSS